MISVVNKYFVTLLFLLQFIISCTNSNFLSITGETMGTTYTVKIHSVESFFADDLKYGIDSILTQVNNQMSTYMIDSEIMKFNYLKVGESVAVSPDLTMILIKSYDISDITNIDLYSEYLFLILFSLHHYPMYMLNYLNIFHLSSTHLTNYIMNCINYPLLQNQPKQQV